MSWRNRSLYPPYFLTPYEIKLLSVLGVLVSLIIALEMRLPFNIAAPDFWLRLFESERSRIPPEVIRSRPTTSRQYQLFFEPAGTCPAPLHLGHIFVDLRTKGQPSFTAPVPSQYRHFSVGSSFVSSFVSVPITILAPQSIVLESRSLATLKSTPAKIP